MEVMNTGWQTQVKAMPTSSFAPVQSGLLQRACACGQHTVAGGECESCRKKREGKLQRTAISAPPVGDVPPIIHDVLRSSGQPLDAGTRAFMEPRFAHDFSGVRVHTDAKAAESAWAVNALAYTVGREVVFGAGQYAPATTAGRRLMAHELTHVMQQAPGMQWLPASLEIAAPGSIAEQEADQSASAVVAGQSVNPTVGEAPKIARQTPPSAPRTPAPTPPAQRRRACVSNERIPDNQMGFQALQGNVYDYFEMNIDWNNRGPGCDCRCGEYRQYVKGHIRINGQKQAKRLWGGANLEENVYHEDAEDNVPYGHRSESQTRIDKFNPERATGCSYQGKDQPGLAAPSGTALDMLLNFKGQTYDVCTNTFGAIHEWRSEFDGVVP
jgi:hypothetical protein